MEETLIHHLHNIPFTSIYIIYSIKLFKNPHYKMTFSFGIANAQTHQYNNIDFLSFASNTYIIPPLTIPHNYLVSSSSISFFLYLFRIRHGPENEMYKSVTTYHKD